MLLASACEADPPHAGATASVKAGSSPASVSAKAGKPAAGKPLTADGHMQLTGEARCPVCAMTVGEKRKLASAIELADGTTYYFCGSGCMMRSWLHPEALLGASKSDVKRVVTRDYFTGDHIDAKAAVWVAGSDVVGPMGPAIVALKDKGAAETFRERHGGKHTFALAELTDELWQKMTGKKATK